MKENLLAIYHKSNYNVNMKTQIVKIGNSQGIRIPKIILEQSQLKNEVELIPEHEQIIIRSLNKARSNWNEAFKTMAEFQDDKLLDEDHLNDQSSWDSDEWVWE